MTIKKLKEVYLNNKLVINDVEYTHVSLSPLFILFLKA